MGAFLLGVLAGAGIVGAIVGFALAGTAILGGVVGVMVGIVGLVVVLSIVNEALL